jgi:hypothetical protein
MRKKASKPKRLSPGFLRRQMSQLISLRERLAQAELKLGVAMLTDRAPPENRRHKRV